MSEQPRRRRYLCREDILAEGARLFRLCAGDPDNKTDAGERLAAWQKRHRPTEREVLAVLRMVNSPYV